MKEIREVVLIYVDGSQETIPGSALHCQYNEDRNIVQVPDPVLPNAYRLHSVPRSLTLRITATLPLRRT